MPLCRSSFSFMVHCVGRRQQHPGRQPRLVKATEPTEHNVSPLLFPHIHQQLQIYHCTMLHLVVAADFLTNPFNFPFISCHFLSAGGTWTQMGGPCLERSYMCWQQSCRARLSWFHRTDFKAAVYRVAQHIFDPLIDPFYRPLWSLYKKWNQTVPNILLKTCRFAAAPALFSSRTKSIYWKSLAVPG